MRFKLCCVTLVWLTFVCFLSIPTDSNSVVRVFVSAGSRPLLCVRLLNTTFESGRQRRTHLPKDAILVVAWSTVFRRAGPGCSGTGDRTRAAAWPCPTPATSSRTTAPASTTTTTPWPRHALSASPPRTAHQRDSQPTRGIHHYNATYQTVLVPHSLLGGVSDT